VDEEKLVGATASVAAPAGDAPALQFLSFNDPIFRLVKKRSVCVIFETVFTNGVGQRHCKISNQKEPILMKRTTSVILAMMLASSGAAFGADAATLWAQNCASCHGKDGSGNTAMGKKLGVKDYTKTQSFSDAEAANVIKNGKGKMKAYGGKLSDADVKALVAYVRSLKK
jgi:cytochrome c6